MAGFAESDSYNINAFLATDAGKNFEVIVRDSQSNPNRAAEVAKELIVNDEIDLMLVASTPENTNPVATTCEAEGVPVLSTKAPWQPWFIGQQGNPGAPDTWRPFDFAFHYFWGLEDVIAVFVNMWNQLETNKQVGGLFPNDADGNAWGDPNVGVAPGFAAGGYTTIDPGRFQNLTDDFTAQINAFRAANAEIVTGVVIPPDFTTFRNQSLQQGFNPKIITVAKAILFPQSVETLGAAGHNLSSEVWWSNTHPFASSLTGQSAADLAADFTCRGRDCRDRYGHDRGQNRVERCRAAALCGNQRDQDTACRWPVAASGQWIVRSGGRGQPDRAQHSDRRRDGSALSAKPLPFCGRGHLFGQAHDRYPDAHEYLEKLRRFESDR